jgi:hypothetical protein
MLETDDLAQAAVKIPVKILKINGSGPSANYEVQVIAGAGDRMLELTVGDQVRNVQLAQTAIPERGRITLRAVCLPVSTRLRRCAREPSI